MFRRRRRPPAHRQRLAERIWAKVPAADTAPAACCCRPSRVEGPNTTHVEHIHLAPAVAAVAEAAAAATEAEGDARVAPRIRGQGQPSTIRRHFAAPDPAECWLQR